ncbi:MAG TPA: cellulase family glycosylhydrolase [Stenotrophobium sp.]|nr:cellulase family glycosylhydrolase [Stenotrophobium sp.]
MTLRIHTAALLLTLFALGGCGVSGTPAAGDDGVASATALHRDGRWMVDGANRVVLLHGLNAVWKLKPYYPPDSAEGFGVADADWLRDHGFNAVRLGVLFAGVMPKQGVIDPAYLDQIDRVVQLLAARHIWVLLDFHQDAYNEKFAGEGFPDWSVYDDGIPFVNTSSFFVNYLTPAVSHTFDNLWADKNGIWDQYAAAWTAVARRWRGQPYILGYEIINEPSAGTQAVTCLGPTGCLLFDATLQKFQEHVLDAIRTVDTTHLVWFEPQMLFQLPFGRGNFTHVDDPQVGFSWHNYACTGAFLNAYGLPSGPDCALDEPTVFSKAETQATAMGATSLLTEFGATDDVSDIARLVGLADTNLVGWLYWAYKTWHDPTTTGGGGAQSLFTSDSDLSTVKPDKLRVLQRTYPQVTAGTPLSLSFNPDTGEFHYRYTPDASAAPTEIYVPVALHYPKGYQATVSGATVTSASGASELTLQNLPGASEVDVTITAN